MYTSLKIFGVRYHKLQPQSFMHAWIALTEGAGGRAGSVLLTNDARDSRQL